jgi:hypothetical protein
MAVFWVVALMMEAARSSETLLNFYQTTRRYNPEDSHLLKYYFDELRALKGNKYWTACLRHLTAYLL